ncbi:hypothetical protein KI387_018047 [Taxus chinensis]|uniref:Beta-lactamase-related domain-containing protein n=1 Tax=Taxus chinensis TaxID=29808 RepID=A0AA38GKA8_TAXCH|nr:hypothetical protein KI387_018047 [Taxus chinensis]
MGDRVRTIQHKLKQIAEAVEATKFQEAALKKHMKYAVNGKDLTGRLPNSIGNLDSLIILVNVTNGTQNIGRGVGLGRGNALGNAKHKEHSTSTNSVFMGSSVKLLNFVGFLLLFLISIFLNGYCTELAEDEMGRFDQVMKMIMEYGKSPGAQLAVSKGGQLKYFKAFGVANRETGEPVTTNHVMRYASISKVFAGTAILKLVQEGRLTLEDKPFVFLENLEPPRGAIVDKRLLDITIQNLLQHTGGWNRTATPDAGRFDVSLYASVSLGSPPPPTPTETIRYIKGLPLDFDPGSAMVYSNKGYLLLGRVVENVTGMNYIEYLQKHILQPLGMRGIVLGRSQVEYLEHNEVRYYGLDGEDILGVSIFPGQGFVNLSYGYYDVSSADSAGGLVGSAGDIVKFVDHIDGLRPPAILKADMVSAMLNAPMPEKRSGKGNPLYDHSQGLHVFVSVDREGKVTSFQHDGGAPGTSTYFMRLMEENITFAYLLNTSPLQSDFEYAAAGNLSEVARSIVNWPHHDLNTMQSHLQCSHMH